MNAEATVAQLRNLVDGYSESIRLSDIKANIAVLFVAIMMGTVLQFRDLYPSYLNTATILMPFMVIFLSLLLSVYPRFPNSGRDRFPILRKSHPDQFTFIADSTGDAATLPTRCAFLSRTLWWKTFTLQIAYTLSVILMMFAGILLMLPNHTSIPVFRT